MRLAIRGFAGDKRIFEDIVATEDADIDALAESHAERMLDYDLHIIDYGFVDEPDPIKRFFRIGTDASGMCGPSN